MLLIGEGSSVRALIPKQISKIPFAAGALKIALGNVAPSAAELGRKVLGMLSGTLIFDISATFQRVADVQSMLRLGFVCQNR